MKKNPQEDSIRKDMAPGRLIADGYLGSDTRNLNEIIQSDAEVLARHNVTKEELAAAMRRLTQKALEGFGDVVMLDGGRSGRVLEFMGWLGCPFKDGSRAAKRNTEITDHRLEKTMRWSDMNIHLIEKHGFFEGQGAEHRLDPEELILFLGLSS